MTDPIRRECERCGVVYTVGLGRDDCPHEPNTTFTRAMRDELLRRLHLEHKQ